MKLFFWQNMPAHHQAPALRVLSELWHDEVHGIWCTDISADRKKLGWKKPQFGALKETYLSADRNSKLAVDIIDKFKSDIHVFSGFHAYAPVVNAFRHSIRVGSQNLALMAEPGISLGWKGMLRPIRAKWIARQYLPNIKLFLAKGKAGVAFYQRAGFSAKILFPYMYQCEMSEVHSLLSVNQPVRLVYAGKFISRKGVDVLIRALVKCRENDWHLQVIGGGAGISKIKNIAEAGGLSNRIHWTGIKPNTEILNLLIANDVCLIPSRFEGWGTVTNEALQSGLAVICSDKVTSRELVETSKAGCVFQSGNSNDLAKCIRSLLSNTKQIVQMKQNAIAYRDRISPGSVGKYLKAVLSHTFLKTQSTPPSPPWLSQRERDA